MDILQTNGTAGGIALVLTRKLQAISKYEYSAKQAKKDGFEQIASIFLETLTQQKSHVKTLFRLLEDSTELITTGISPPAFGPTLQNLREGISTEKEMIDLLDHVCIQAWDEGQKKAHTKLKLFRQISEFYLQRFGKLAENISEDKVFRKDHKVKWICRKCGLIYESERALHNCPACEHPQAYFEILSENY